MGPGGGGQESAKKVSRIIWMAPYIPLKMKYKSVQSVKMGATPVHNFFAFLHMSFLLSPVKDEQQYKVKDKLDCYQKCKKDDSWPETGCLCKFCFNSSIRKFWI